MGTYCIKTNYRINPRRDNRSDIDPHPRSTPYWNPTRIDAARFYQLPVYRVAADLIGRTAPRSVADVGCGVGVKLAAIHDCWPHIAYTGVDGQEAIDLCKARYPWGRWHVIDLDSPHPEPPFRADLIICADVIEHLDDPDRLLSFLGYVCAADGHILLSTPDRDRLRGSEYDHSPNPEHVREWNHDELRAYLNLRGFQIVWTRHVLPLGAALNRLFLREVVLRALRLKSLRYNQMLLLKPSKSPHPES